MTQARNLAVYTEREVANMAIPGTPKGLTATFVADTENTLTFDNATTFISFLATFDAWLSFVEHGTETDTPNRFYWEANTRLAMTFGDFHDKLYVQNVNSGEGDGEPIYVIYRD